MFNTVTITAMEYNTKVLHLLFTYLPITLDEDVRPTCKKTVNGN